MADTYTITQIVLPNGDTCKLHESKSPAYNGTAVSLVTTGEKYRWNNKTSLAIGTTSTTAAAGNHTHSAATTSAAGFMSSTDKTKLDGMVIATLSEVQSELGIS